MDYARTQAGAESAIPEPSSAIVPPCRSHSSTFQEEYRESLRKHGVKHDEQLRAGLKQWPVSRAFSAPSEAVNIPGRCPGALPDVDDEAAPLALYWMLSLSL
jgi:hypothetical protein